MRAPVHEPRLLAAAGEHLAPDDAARWRELLEPAILLDHATDGEPVAGHYGGDGAVLPPDMPWPVWEEYGELSPWLTLDCAALPRGSFGLPESGLLQFFVADGQLWGKRTPWTMGASAGFPEAARVVHVPDGAGLRRRAPKTLTCVEAEPLTAWIDLTPPDHLDDDVPYAFEAAVERDHFPTKIGGHTYAMQDPPVDELVRYAVFEGKADEERVEAEIPHWRPLLQFVPHQKTALDGGDYWNLYWFIRDDDLSARRFDRALMIEQCT